MSAQLNQLSSASPKEGFVIVTPEMAANWRMKYHYEGQRVFKQWHCDNLAKMMSQGRFRPKTQVAFVRLNGKLYCTNGQHTLAAIEKSGTPQLLSVVINDAASEQDVADDFARHDTHLTRQFADSLVAHRLHEELGVSPTALNAIAAGCVYYGQLVGDVTNRSQALTNDEKLEIVRRYADIGVTAWMFFDGHHRKKYLTRKTTLASAMFCASKQPEAAEQFWTELARDDGLRATDPRKILLEWLRSRLTPGGSWGKVGDKPKVATDHEMIKAAAVAWNAWLRGDQLKVIKVNFDSLTATFKNIGTLQVRRSKAR